MKLGVDARMMYGVWQHRGIGRYTKSILEPLDEKNITAFLPQKKTLETYKTISEGIGIFPWWEQKVLPRLAKSSGIDYLLCPSITSPVGEIKGVKKIVVIYDLIFMASFKKLPPSHSLYNNLGRLYRRFIAPVGYKTADVMISISEFSRDELFKRFDVPKEKVQVIPCSIPNDWFVSEILPAAKREKYLVTVTGDAPSKNLPRLLNAFAEVIKNGAYADFNLRIVGVAKKSKPVFIEQVKNLGIESNVIFESFLDNNQLQQLYQNAWASLTLSLFEGFGIPIVEAMASGTPVVCSNTTSMPEVAGKNAVYADPENLPSIISGLKTIMDATAQERDAMSQTNIIWARKFSEEAVAQVIKDFWLKLV